MKNTKLIILIALFICMTAPAANAGSPWDPSLEWWSMTTEHFDIHHPIALREMAERLAPIAEEVHSVISKEMDYEPLLRTQIVLADNYDVVNGMSTSAYYGLIILFTVPPEGESELADYDDWLRTIFYHEYTHRIEMGQHRWPFSLLRYTLGNFGLASPNMLMPRFMAEGYAIRNESKYTTGGRLRSTYLDMVFREDILSDNFYHLGKTSEGLNKWPGGSYKYYYGSWFIDYYEKINGPDSWTEYSQDWSSGSMMLLLPFNAPNLLSRFRTGQWLSDYWSKWWDSLIVRYQDQLDLLSANPISTPAPLTDFGYYTGNVRRSPKGYIAYSEQTPFRHARVRAIDPVSGEEVFDIDAKGEAKIAFFPDGRMLISQFEVCDEYYLFFDLYVYDPASDHLERLTEGRRLSDPDVSPDGQMIVAAHTGPEIRHLVLLNVDGGHIRDLTPPIRELLCEAPRFSPDGKTVAASCFEEGGRRDIYLIDVESGERTGITADRYSDLSPVWSADGAEVLFASDRTGISNIWSYRPAEKTMRRITNVRSGLYDPEISADGKTLYAAWYGIDGFNIAALDRDQVGEIAEEKYLLPDREPKTYEYKKVDYELSRYLPFKSAAPRYWMPNVNFSPVIEMLGLLEPISNVGVSSSGYDALQQHSWAAYAGLQMNKLRPNYMFSYSNDQLFPTITASVSDLTVPASVYVDLSESDPYSRYKLNYERYFNASLDVAFNFSRVEWGIGLNLGYNFTRVFPITKLPSYETNRETGVYTGPSLSFSYSDVNYYGLSVSPTDGRMLSLAYSESNKVLGSDYNVSTAIGSYTEYIGLPYRMTILAGLSGGANFGEKLRSGVFTLGGVEGFLGAPHGVSLRGYYPGQFEGNYFGKLRTEFRFPMLDVEYGYGTWPFFLDHISGRIFHDYGYAWDYEKGEEPINFADWRGGFGTEITLDMTIFYLLGLSLKVGIAYGYSDGGMPIYYITTNNLF